LSLGSLIQRLARSGSFLGTLQSAEGRYSFEAFKADLLAALTVAIVALPQSMAYAIIAGVHPKYGLYAAIIPVIVSSILGSSRFLISGPTNAISMLIFSSMATASVAGMAVSHMPEAQKIQILFTLAMLVGLIQFVMGIARFGTLTHFISHSVIVGFTTGAGILIAFNQIKNLLGLSFAASHHFHETVLRTFKHIHQTEPTSLLLGVSTVAIIVMARRISVRIPGAFIAVVVSAFAVKIFEVDKGGVALVGMIPTSFPPLSMPHFDMEIISAIFMPALAIAILGIVEALSISKSLANMSGERIDANREFIGQGVSNIAAGFFSAIPGSGSFTRSALNYSTGAKSGFAGVLSGVFLLFIIFGFAPLARFIPIPTLAGILMVIAFSMVDFEAIRFSFKTTRADRLVMLTTLFSTLALGMEKAVFIGVLLSIVLFLRKVSHPQLSRVVVGEDDHSFKPHTPGTLYCPQIVIYLLEGPLFFGAISELEERLYSYDDKQSAETIIMVVKHVRCIDATGAHALKRYLEGCKKEGAQLIFAQPGEAVLETFTNSGLLEELGEKNIVPSVSKAIHLAYESYVDKKICESCTQRVFFECNPESEPLCSRK
jgi:sulfate permease, SulP family